MRFARCALRGYKKGVAHSLLLCGSYDRLWDAHIRLMTWIEDRGSRSAGPFRCMYLRLPSPQGEPLTELHIPIEPEQ